MLSQKASKLVRPIPRSYGYRRAFSIPSTTRRQAREANERRNHTAKGTITDESVPEGHKGLHGFLYGEGGAEAHEDDPISSENEARAEQRIAVKDFLAKRLGFKTAGVYAVSNEAGSCQYVGFARSIYSALKVHSAVLGSPRCCFVETRLLPSQAVANRSRLQAEADAWLAELGSTPPGNAEEKYLWEAKVVTDVETFEEKKLKLQKAMGEHLVDASPDQTVEQRRQNLLSAVSQDDWSSVIDAQTQETVAQQPADNRGSVGSMPSNPASPFSTVHVQQRIGKELLSADSMTVETVDTALEEVRPFLIADGGNVEVVSVSEGVVALRLQGACGTCASSSATMKMGIERALKAAFGAALKEVRQVDSQDTSSSVASINAHLDMLRPAIKSYGGSVEVKEVAGATCTIHYDGPPTIGGGIVAAIKAQFPDINEVILN